MTKEGTSRKRSEDEGNGVERIKGKPQGAVLNLLSFLASHSFEIVVNKLYYYFAVSLRCLSHLAC